MKNNTTDMFDSGKNAIMKNDEKTPEVSKVSSETTISIKIVTNSPEEDVETINKILEEENISSENNTVSNENKEEEHVISFNSDSDDVVPILEKIQEGVQKPITVDTKVLDYTNEIKELEVRITVINETISKMKDKDPDYYKDDISKLETEKADLEKKISELKAKNGQVEVKVKVDS